MIEFVIPIVPVGQRRARHATMRGKGGKVFSRTYKAKKQEYEEQTLQAYLIAHVPPKPLEGPVMLWVDCYLPVPASKPQWWKDAANWSQVLPTVVPDLDNMVKHLKDCCTTMRFWLDDKQVVFIQARKHYSDTPRWEVSMREIQQPTNKAGWEQWSKENVFGNTVA